MSYDIKEQLVEDILSCLNDEVIRGIESIVEKFNLDSDTSNYILTHPKIRERQQEIIEKYHEFSVSREKKIIEDFLDGHGVEELVKEDKEYKDIISEEGKMADLNEYSRVIILGREALPMTAVIYHTLFDSECTRIDTDHDSIRFFNKFLNIVGLIKNRRENGKRVIEKKVRVKHGNYLDHRLRDYDLIVVTTSCTPKKEVFEHIYKELEHNPDATVIYRTPIGLYRLIYNSTDPKDINGFEIMGSKNKGFMFESILLKRNSKG